MRRIFVSDIFGRTPALEELASGIPGDVELVDPYDGKRMDFRNEAEAYRFFCSEVGLDKYTEQLAGKIAVMTLYLAQCIACVNGYVYLFIAFFLLDSWFLLLHI